MPLLFSPAAPTPPMLPLPPQKGSRKTRRNPMPHKAIARGDANAKTGPATRRADDLRPGFDPANLRRCPGCGAMVYLWPCLACQRRSAA